MDGLYQDSGCQWVDGPPLPSLAPPPISPSGAVAGMHGDFSAPPAPYAAQNVGARAAPGAPVQDMVFQWVDCPSLGRPMQQQYMHPSPAPPYYGMESPAYGGVPRYHGSTGGGYDLDRSAAYPSHPPAGMPGVHQAAEQARVAQGGGFQQGARDYGGRAQDTGKSYGKDGGKGNNRGQATAQGWKNTGGAGFAAAQKTPETENMSREALVATLTDVMETLYQDRIRPLGSYVKGRLKEKNCSESLVKNFAEQFSQFPDLFLVQQSASDETVFLLKKEPDWFKGWVDIDAPNDPYDEATWEAFRSFLSSEHAFAGGRYGMARELLQRNLAFLAGYSLGEICHMVQLAIQHRNLIVYHRKMLKPIQSVLNQPAQAEGSAPGEGDEIRDMDDLCSVLFRLSGNHPQGIRLCRMKQMVKHEYNRRLSETAFQCTKLVELFNQDPLSSLFVLDTESDGKNIYVRLGDVHAFPEHWKRLHDECSRS